MSHYEHPPTLSERERYAESLTQRFNAQLNAREREDQLSNEAKLDDWSGLVVHTITCFITDPPSLIANNWAAQHIDIGLEKGTLNIDVDFNDYAASSDSPNLIGATIDKLKGKELLRWGFGEGAGDLLAIPMTVALQRISPETMYAIREMMEPAVGAVYRDSADKAAQHWAEKHGVERFSEEFQAYKDHHYEQEMRRLPQAVVWTALSMGIGIVAQKEAATQLGFECDESYKELLVGSLIGKAITGVAANLPRIIAPEETGKADHFMHHKVVKPVTNIVEHMFHPATHETVAARPDMQLQ